MSDSRLHTAVLCENDVIFNSLPDAMALLNNQYEVVTVNPAFVALFGFTNPQLVGEQLIGYIVPSGAAQECERIQESIALGKRVKFNTVRKRSDGQPVHVLLTAYPLMSQARQTGICIIYQDIAEQTQELRQLKETENLLRTFAGAVPDKSFIFDEDGRYIEAFAANLMRPREEFLGRTLHDIFPSRIADLFLGQIRYTLASGKPQFTIRELELDHEKEVCEERIAPMNYLVNGKRTVAIVLTDINKRTERILFSNYALQRRSNFINDIINENRIVDEQAVEFAKTLGLDFSLPLFCCLLHSEQCSELSMRDAEYNNRRNIKNSLLEIVGRELDYIVWDCGDDIGVICQMQTSPNQEVELQIAYRLQEKINCYNQDLKIIIGIGGRQAGLHSLQKSYRQAWSAVLAGQCQTDANQLQKIYHYKDIGILQFLTQCTTEEVANEFVDETIGKLIAYDETKETEWITTMEAIVQSGSLKEAADKICLHPKSVYYRKLRIEKILGKSVDAVNNRLAIAIAIKLYRIHKVKLK